MITCDSKFTKQRIHENEKKKKLNEKVKEGGGER